ncbi:MAG: hypothetical protein LBC35_03880 [Coriobacteriales bacterium]|jgi:hypothetical protein|nr:hypothetical protein [Coriobacteriales bacterium]
MSERIRPVLIGGSIGLVVVALFFAVLFFVPPLLNNNEAIINPNVVVYNEETSPFKITASDKESVTVSSLDGISETTILSADITENTPDGLLRKVISTEPVDGGYKVTTVPAALTDAIEKCDVHYTITMNTDGTYEIANSSANETSPLFGIQKAYAADDNPDNLFSEKGSFYDISVGNIIEVDLTINSGDITMRMVNHFYAGCDFDFATVSFEKSFGDYLPNLPSFEFFVGPVPVVFTNSLDAVLSAEVNVSSVTFNTGGAIDKAFGFEYTSAEGLNSVNEDSSYWSDFEPKVEADSFSASLDAALTVTLGTRLYGFAGPDLSVGVKSDADATLTKLNTASGIDDAITIPFLDGQYSGRISEKVTVPISGTFVVEIPDFNPFSSDDSIVLVDMEIFNTGDMITLFEFSKRSRIRGTIHITSYVERGLEVGIPADMWGGWDSPLCLLILEQPMSVSARDSSTPPRITQKEVRVINLPYTPSMDSYDGQEVTIEVDDDDWGYWPSDISGALLDISLQKTPKIEPLLH